MTGGMMGWEWRHDCWTPQGRIVLAESGLQVRPFSCERPTWRGGYVLEVRERSGRTLRSNVVKA